MAIVLKLLKFKTIRGGRILFVFSMTFLLMLLLLLSLNKIFFYDYYISSNNSNMEHAAKGFILNYNGNNLDEAGSLLKKRTGGAFELFDKNSRQMTTNKDVPIMRPEHISDFRQLVESAGPSGHFEINANVNNLGSSSDSSVTQRIIYGIILPTGEMLVITKAMGFVQEASNMFFLHL